MNYRISNSLFESIVNVTNPQVQEAEVDKAHFCATHVEHAMLGLGTCISEQHAEPDEQGQIAWYTVEFPTGTHRIQTSNLRIVEGKSHSHSKKMTESEQIDELIESLGDAAGLRKKADALPEHERYKKEFYNTAAKHIESGNIKKLAKHLDDGQTKQHHGDSTTEHARTVALRHINDKHLADLGYVRNKPSPVKEGNDGNLANNAKPYDKVTHGDVIAGRLGKDEMGGKKKVNKEQVEQVDEDKYDRMLSNMIKRNPGVLKTHSKEVKRTNDIESGKELGRQIKKNPGVLKTYSAAVKRDKKMYGEEAEHVDEKAVEEASMGHAGTVTMKQVDKSNATPQVKAAIKKSAPDIKSYADRAAALTAAGIKRESVEDLDEVKMADLPSRKIQGRSYGASKPEPSAFDILKGPRDKDLKSIATKKKPVSAGKALKPKAIKEGISQTIINYDDFRIDVTDNPTYGDYLRALQTMVESRDESIQQEVVAIATAAYDEKIDSIIVESKARQLFAGKLDELRKSGAKVLDESYIVESDSTYVEYTVEKDGVRTQYVHIGTNGNK